MSAGELLELCTWQARVGGVDAAVRALQSAPRLDAEGNGLAGAWTADSGPLNRVIHLWRYEDAAQRAKLQATATQGLIPPLDVAVHCSSELLEPLPFSPRVEARELGAFYEFRSYAYPASAIPELVERWLTAIEWRQTLSPLVGVWTTPASAGASLTRLVHCWAYRDANDWQAVRALARGSGRWPPTSGKPSTCLEQSSQIALPVGFSPLR